MPFSGFTILLTGSLAAALADVPLVLLTSVSLLSDDRLFGGNAMPAGGKLADGGMLPLAIAAGNSGALFGRGGCCTAAAARFTRSSCGVRLITAAGLIGRGG